MLRIVAVLGICAGTAACGVAAKVDARNSYQQSASAYKQCLIENSAAPQRCEGLRMAMETDERMFNNMAAGVNPGSNRSSTVTVLNR